MRICLKNMLTLFFVMPLWVELKDMSARRADFCKNGFFRMSPNTIFEVKKVVFVSCCVSDV